jgi:hypothetical protein
VRFGLSQLSRTCTWFVGFVTVVRFADVAAHSNWLIADQGFDSMRQNAFALAAPAFNVLA